MTVNPIVASLSAVLVLAACGGGGGGDGAGGDGRDASTPLVLQDAPGAGVPGATGAIDAPGSGSPDEEGVPPSSAPPDPETEPGTNTETGAGPAPDTSPDAEPNTDDPEPAALAPASDTAVYAVTLENFWNATDFPQGFPEDAHLSLIGGATHNASVSFWEPGGIATEGVEDLAERGEIDLFLVEDVVPAIEAGLADSEIAVRTYTDPQVDGVPGRLAFDVALQRDFPRVTLLTMLGPSPDWFVGVDGEPLWVDGAWLETLDVDLPLYDGGSKSNLTPVMDGPGIHPNDPIATIAYDPATGTYLPRAAPQLIARLTFRRTR